MKFIISSYKMYIKCLILIAILFVCTSCELLTDKDKAMEIPYTKTDKLNIQLSLINIPSNVVEYRIITTFTSNDVKVLKHENTTNETRKKVSLNELIERDQNYSLELRSAGGLQCSSKDVFYLIAKDINRISDSGTNKHKCLYQEKSCNIQFDFEKKCKYPNPVTVKANESKDSKPVTIKIDRPDRYENVSLQGSRGLQPLDYKENEKISLICHPEKVTNATYNLTWTQYYFPLNKSFHVSQQLPARYRFMMKMTLRSMDDGTTVYCTGMNEEMYTGFILNLNVTQTGSQKIEKIMFNQQKPITHSCSEDENLLSKNSIGNFMCYINSSVEIQKSDNGSVFFCMNYKKQNYYIDTFTYEATREIHNEVMYIYEDNTAAIQGSENVAVWASTAIIAAVVSAGGIALLLYKRTKNRNPPIDTQDHTHESPTEVVYAEINALPCTTEKPILTQEEEPYATIIGVLEKNKHNLDVINSNNF